MSTTKSKGEKIPAEKGVTAIFLSHYMGWNAQCLSVALLILDYSRLSRRKWGNQPTISDISFKEAASHLIQLNPSLTHIIKLNSFDVYVRYFSSRHCNYDMGYVWFMSLDETSRERIFAEYSLDEASQLLSLSQKNCANFKTALAQKSPSECVRAYI